MGWGGRLRLILTMKSWGNMMNEEMLLTNIYVRSRVFSGLRIPLIIVPNPATSSPPTRISRKSAIQAHCLHAK